MQKQADLVIIGAGIVGCSTAYFLARHGWRNVVVLDQGPLFKTGGSTSHAPGLVFQTNASRTMTCLAGDTIDLYNSLQWQGQPCFYPVGSLEVATTTERLEDIKHKMGFTKSWGVKDARLLTPDQTLEKSPLIDAQKILGSYHVPGDGIAKAVNICQALAEYATNQKCARFIGQTKVTDIEIVNGQVNKVITDQGAIATSKVLVCAGIWGPRIGRLVGVSIPLMPMEHLYARTAPLKELAGETREVAHPMVRHQDMSMYFRQQGDAYGFGSYRHEPLPVDPDDILSHKESPEMPSLRTFTPEHFQVGHQAAIELMPPLKGVELTYKINGMFSFTPDGGSLLGPSPEIRGFWVAEAVWVTHGGGVGKVMAEWLTTGVPSIDLREANINRFHAYAHTPVVIKARAEEQYRQVYDILHPLKQTGQPRNLRISPFHPRLEKLGAVFFENVGWERPQWFEANSDLLKHYSVPDRSGWEARSWSPIQGAEHLAVRENVGLFDLTAFTKLEVAGPDALGFLQKIAANQMDQPVGKIIYTSLLDSNGGIKADLTITRLAEDRFWVLTGSGMGSLDYSWLRLHLPADRRVHIADITSSYCTLGLWGPKARQLLQTVCDDDLSNEAFAYYTAQPITIGGVPALALRLSYAGELGWEIYTAMEYGLRLWDILWEAGKPHGMCAVGLGAFDSLRLEKGYRLWGADIHTEYNPCEAGLEWTTRLDEGDFIGRDALMRIKDQGASRKLCCMTLDDPKAVAMGKEPLLDGDQVLGYVTSANYGYSVAQFILYGYLPLSHASVGTAVQVEYFDRRFNATVVQDPLFDPQGQRLKS